jgi:hypothetical protein
LYSLIELANKVLAAESKKTAPVPPADVAEAIGEVNDAFDEGGEVICCSDVGACTEEAQLVLNEAADVNLPTEFALEQNAPNPFNPTTRIKLAIPTASNWTLAIYNVAGQLVQRYEGSTSSPAYVDVTWDGRDRHGRPVATGVYFYRMRAGSFNAVKKMVLLK